MADIALFFIYLVQKGSTLAAPTLFITSRLTTCLWVNVDLRSDLLS